MKFASRFQAIYVNWTLKHQLILKADWFPLLKNKLTFPLKFCLKILTEVDNKFLIWKSQISELFDLHIGMQASFNCLVFFEIFRWKICVIENQNYDSVP